MLTCEASAGSITEPPEAPELVKLIYYERTQDRFNRQALCAGRRSTR